MTKFSKYIGLDVHKETIAVGIADGRGGPPHYWGIGARLRTGPGSCGAWSSSSTAPGNSYGFAMRPDPAGMVSTGN